MDIKVLPASIADKLLIQRMMELYQYDFSEFSNIDLDEHGYFGYSHLDHYWVETNRYPFLLRVNDKLAGFALVNQLTNLPGSNYSLAEFFILRKYRHQGIGRQVAFDIFNLFSGRWEIYQAHTNLAAKKFWQSVLETYTKGSYTETVIEEGGWAGIIRCFDNTNIFKS
ncbi:MAG: GNAT family N-acetyltransferase [Cyanobacteria bacterium P01_A01_bin.40]